MSDLSNCRPNSRPSCPPAGRCPDPVPAPTPDPPPCRPRPEGLPAPSRPGAPSSDLGEPAALREALLARFERPEDVAALRRLGAMLFELVDESGQWGPRRHGVVEVSPTRLCLRAACADLFHVARDLAAVAADRFESDLVGEDHRLAEQAERWAAGVTRLAAAIGATLEEGSGPVS